MPAHRNVGDTALAFTEAARAELEVLRDAYGTWSLAPSGSLSFESQTVRAAYEVAEERTQSAMDAYVRASEAWIQHMRERANRGR